MNGRELMSRFQRCGIRRLVTYGSGLYSILLLRGIEKPMRFGHAAFFTIATE
jgi:hypothetical protein